MLRLPDDVLLLVMRNLDVPTLLDCRLVCRKLADLSLHPDVWRHRHVSALWAWASAVLRLAPCLASLQDGLPWTWTENIQSLFETTRCAAAKLHLDAATPEQSARIIRNQVALGRLRCLRVSFETCSAVLMETVLATTSILHTLFIATSSPFKPPTSSRHYAVSPSPSIKCFEYRESGLPATEFCTKILTCHTATLEKVALKWCSGLCTSNSLAPLLATMPHLKELTCCPLPGMQALASCPSLQALHLSISDGGITPSTLCDTAMFLRRAGQLRKVTLTWALAGWNDVGTELVEAVGSSVESLALQSTILPGEVVSKLRPQLRALLRVLPSLQSLVWLRVAARAVPDALLLAITPASAPALRSLKILDWAWELDEEEEAQGAQCAHDFMHRRAVKVLLQANPSLKLSVDCSEFSCSSTVTTCGACRQGCDKECEKLLAGILNPLC